MGAEEVRPILVLPPPCEVTPCSGASVALVGKMGQGSSQSLRAPERIHEADQ